MGDDTDPFTLTNNNLFSPWSNPSSYSPLTGATNYSVWLYNQVGNNISIQVKTTANSSLSLPPSKPNILWHWIGPIRYGWIHLNWNAEVFDGYPTEPDYEWSELQRKIGSNPWYTVYSGPNKYWSDHSITYDPNGTTPVYFRVRVRDNQGLWSLWSDLYSTKMLKWIPWKAGSDETINNEILNFALNQNFPNPFNPTTTISYAIKDNGLVKLKVYDILGTEVAELVNELKEAGNYSVTFNASVLPSGIYFYTLTSGNFMATKKLILLK